jgi:hypothetical protein
VAGTHASAKMHATARNRVTFIRDSPVPHFDSAVPRLRPTLAHWRGGRRMWADPNQGHSAMRSSRRHASWRCSYKRREAPAQR